MNEHIKNLALEATEDMMGIKILNQTKFAMLIIQECIEQAHSVADLRDANDDMIYGADIAAARIAKHFGVE
jgi:hypothetical protein